MQSFLCSNRDLYVMNMHLNYKKKMVSVTAKIPIYCGYAIIYLFLHCMVHTECLE